MGGIERVEFARPTCICIPLALRTYMLLVTCRCSKRLHAFRRWVVQNACDLKVFKMALLEFEIAFSHARFGLAFQTWMSLDCGSAVGDCCWFSLGIVAWPPWPALGKMRRFVLREKTFRGKCWPPFQRDERKPEGQRVSNFESEEHPTTISCLSKSP